MLFRNSQKAWSQVTAEVKKTCAATLDARLAQLNSIKEGKELKPSWDDNEEDVYTSLSAVPEPGQQFDIYLSFLIM